jgi:hypothetical protein
MIQRVFQGGSEEEEYEIVVYCFIPLLGPVLIWWRCSEQSEGF